MDPIEHAIQQLALYMQARDAREYGVTEDGKPTMTWNSIGPMGQEEYVKDATAVVAAMQLLRWSPPADAGIIPEAGTPDDNWTAFITVEQIIDQEHLERLLTSINEDGYVANVNVARTPPRPNPGVM